MDGRWRRTLAVAMLAMVAGCGLFEDLVDDATDTDAALEVLLAQVALEPGVRVFVTGPVPAGTRMEEQRTVPEVVLTVPEVSGRYYLFYIDDLPYNGLHHPVRYAWVDTTAQVAIEVDAATAPRVIPPGDDATPLRFTVHKEIRRDDVDVIHLAIDDTWVPPSPGAKGLATFATIEAPLGTGGDNEVARFPLQCEDGEICLKRALVTDLGDSDGIFERYKGDEAAEDADGLVPWLDGYGFPTERISQDTGNEHGYVTEAQDLLDRIDAYGQFFAANPPDASCCHEFFFYITGHGDGGGIGLELYDLENEQIGDVHYLDIVSRLAKYPSYVKITVFIEACYSGHAIGHFESLANGRCGLNVITSTTADMPSVFSGLTYDSVTKNFGEADFEDGDGDTVSGDIFDRLIAAITYTDNKWPNRVAMGTPQYFSSPGGTTAWCSLDGNPCVTPPPNPYCGDGTVTNPPEDCDPPGLTGGCPSGETCSSTCKCGVEYDGCEGIECGIGPTGEECGECPSGWTCVANTCHKNCSTTNCSQGCCTATTCEPGTAQDACGTGGADCMACGAEQTCTNKQCVDIPPCGPDTCPNGCCDASGACVEGTADGACGDGGAACADCTANQEHCYYQACGDCADVCPDGCCAGGACHVPPAQVDEQCGVGGIECVDCTASGLDCSPEGSCVCEYGSHCDGCCTEDATACLPGTADDSCGQNGDQCETCPDDNACVDHSCKCTPESCPNGCCDGETTCVSPGNLSAYCGLSGEPCDNCLDYDPSRVCVEGDCISSGEKACCLKTGGCVTYSPEACLEASEHPVDVETCDPDPCPAPVACCKEVGSDVLCFEWIPPACEADGGVPMPGVASCSPDPCGSQTGCCVPHDSTGCDDENVYWCACEFQPSCCDGAWSQACIDVALEWCGLEC